MELYFEVFYNFMKIKINKGGMNPPFEMLEVALLPYHFFVCSGVHQFIDLCRISNFNFD